MSDCEDIHLLTSLCLIEYTIFSDFQFSRGYRIGTKLLFLFRLSSRIGLQMGEYCLHYYFLCIRTVIIQIVFSTGLYFNMIFHKTYVRQIVWTVAVFLFYRFLLSGGGRFGNSLANKRLLPKDMDLPPPYPLCHPRLQTPVAGFACGVGYRPVGSTLIRRDFHL